MRPTPSKTPGTKNASQKRVPPRARTSLIPLEKLKGPTELPEEKRARGAMLSAAARLSARSAVAGTVAKQKEFQNALEPAARAPGSSVQVRFVETICASGKPIETTHSAIVSAPQHQTHARPS